MRPRSNTSTLFLLQISWESWTKISGYFESECGYLQPESWRWVIIETFSKIMNLNMSPNLPKYDSQSTKSISSHGHLSPHSSKVQLKNCFSFIPTDYYILKNEGWASSAFFSWGSSGTRILFTLSTQSCRSLFPVLGGASIHTTMADLYNQRHGRPCSLCQTWTQKFFPVLHAFGIAIMVQSG